MYINLNIADIKIISEESYGNKVIFIYNGKKYYCKKSNNIDNIYNELIACRIGKAMGISCCEYYPAEYNGFVGVVSEYYENPKAISIEDYLKGKFKTDFSIHNNIIDLRDCFYMDFDELTANRLTNDLIDIFMFDAIIGNADRNITNYMIIIDGENTRFAPLFDCENMLDDNAIYDGNYSLGVDEKDYKNKEENNILYKFLDWSDIEIYKRFLRYLELIKEEQIKEIFENIGKSMIIEDSIKNKILKKFEINRSMITNYINSYGIKKKKV